MGLLTGGGGFGSGSPTPTRNPDRNSTPFPRGYTASTAGPTPTSINQQDQRQQTAYNEGQAAVGSIYGYDTAMQNAAMANLMQQMGLSNSMYGLQGSEAKTRYQQQMAALGLDNSYLNKKMGFAGENADLARQMLGYDKQELGLNKQDYARDWRYKRWKMLNDQIARGAYETPGRRYEDKNLGEMLQTRMAGFGVDENRIGTRGEQVDLNLAEQLAGLQNQLGQNQITGKYAGTLFANQQQQMALNNALQNLGFSGDMAQNLISQAQTNANANVLLGQILGSQLGGYDTQNTGYGYTPQVNTGASSPKILPGESWSDYLKRTGGP